MGGDGGKDKKKERKRTKEQVEREREDNEIAAIVFILFFFYRLKPTEFSHSFSGCEYDSKNSTHSRQIPEQICNKFVYSHNILNQN